MQIDYSLLLDGLMAEREQGITIDVAYRYFTTEKLYRGRYSGTEEYTKETWQSVHPLQILPLSLWMQSRACSYKTRRHARICALMGIRYFVFAVNKMDLVDYSEERFKEIVDQIQELSGTAFSKCQDHSVSAITEVTMSPPIPNNMPWYTQEPLLVYFRILM